MMKILLVLVSSFLLSCKPNIPNDIIVCVPTKIINLTNEWTLQDQSHFEFNRMLCSREFKSSVCLKKFIKTGTLTYQIICSK